MATLTVQQVAKAGVTPSYAAAAGGGDNFVDDGSEKSYIHVKNGGGGNITVTVAAQTTSLSVNGYGILTVANFAVVIANGAEAKIGPFPGAYVNTSGKISITYSGVSSVTIGVFKL